MNSCLYFIRIIFSGFPSHIIQNYLFLHIWSYYPVGAIDPEIAVNDTEPYAGNTASFTSYTTNNTDLLLAYNREYREFQKNANGEHDYNSEGVITNDIIGSDAFNVHFYHALAAVKFELSSTTSGADIHSITLCYVDNSKQNVATGAGIATTGDCVATGSGEGTGSVSFVWSNLSNKKALHYEFDSSHSVAGGYTSTGSGVLFMIPQTVNNIKIIVEFSKNGSTQYCTKVQNLENVTWEAGKYYTYKLGIGEFHVLGEKMTELTDILIAGLKSDQGFFKRPEGDPVPSKGVTKMALITNGYGLEVKSQTGDTSVSMHSNAYGGDNDVPSQVDYINFDLLPYTLDAHNNLTSFGDGTPEQYSKRVYFQLTKNENNKNPTIDTSRAAAYVFETGGKDTFFLYFRPENGSNNGGFKAELKGLFVVEVATDPNIPSNFPLNPWP